MDEVNIDEFVKEASIALEDEEQLREFIKEKATIAIERFLVRVTQSFVLTMVAWTYSLTFVFPFSLSSKDYIPKMSIPVEKRDLPDGWTITCRGADGGHLTLKDLVIKVSVVFWRLAAHYVSRFVSHFMFYCFLFIIQLWIQRENLTCQGKLLSDHESSPLISFVYS